MKRKCDICLAATIGGHYEQILRLKGLEEYFKIKYFTNKCEVSKLSYPSAFKIHSPNMNNKFLRFFGMIIVFFQSFFFLLKYKPKAIISTGSGEMFPLLWIGKKIFKKKIIFIESYAKIKSGNKTGKATYKFADLFIVQWKQMLDVYPNAKYFGGLY